MTVAIAGVSTTQMTQRPRVLPDRTTGVKFSKTHKEGYMRAAWAFALNAKAVLSLNATDTTDTICLKMRIYHSRRVEAGEQSSFSLPIYEEHYRLLSICPSARDPKTHITMKVLNTTRNRCHTVQEIPMSEFLPGYFA